MKTKSQYRIVGENVEIEVLDIPDKKEAIRIWEEIVRETHECDCKLKHMTIDDCTGSCRGITLQDVVYDGNGEQHITQVITNNLTPYDKAWAFVVTDKDETWRQAVCNEVETPELKLALTDSDYRLLCS